MNKGMNNNICLVQANGSFCGEQGDAAIAPFVYCAKGQFKDRCLTYVQQSGQIVGKNEDDGI